MDSFPRSRHLEDDVRNGMGPTEVDRNGMSSAALRHEGGYSEGNLESRLLLQ